MTIFNTPVSGKDAFVSLPTVFGEFVWGASFRGLRQPKSDSKLTRPAIKLLLALRNELDVAMAIKVKARSPHQTDAKFSAPVFSHRWNSAFLLYPMFMISVPSYIYHT